MIGPVLETSCFEHVASAIQTKLLHKKVPPTVSTVTSFENKLMVATRLWIAIICVVSLTRGLRPTRARSYLKRQFVSVDIGQPDFGLRSCLHEHFEDSGWVSTIFDPMQASTVYHSGFTKFQRCPGLQMTPKTNITHT